MAKLGGIKSFKTIYKYDTELSADSVEWCPHEPNKDIFVCGNYQLIEDKESNVENRLGQILLFHISVTSGLKLLQKLNTAAVLDQKWCPNQINNVSVLGVVNANKNIEIYQLENERLKLLTRYMIINNETDTLILSLDWSTGKYDSNQPYIVCSDSKGDIHVLQFINNKLVLEKSWHAHEFQAWITGFYYWDSNIIFSGGDDAAFLKFDIRVGDKPIAKNRLHETGVTAFHSNKSKEYVVATGSYDEHVRIWDIRNIKKPSDSLRMPGTLWRLKWDPFVQQFLLSACMLAGIHIIDSSEMKIVKSYYEHKNISYGADWSYLTADEVNKFDNEGNVIIGTCSFYDHLLCISKTFCDFKDL